MNKLEKLEIENRYLKKIIDNLPASIYWKDKAGKYLGCNKRNANFIKLKDSKEIIGKSDFDLLPREVAEAVVQNDMKIMSRDLEKYFEEKALDEHGNSVIYLTHKIPLRDEKGKITGILGVSMDITKRKEMEQELRRLKEEAEHTHKIATTYLADVNKEVTGDATNKKSIKDHVDNIRHYFQAIIDNIPANIYWKDKKGIYLWCNDSMLKMFGISRNQCIGKTDFDIHSKEVAEAVWQTDKTIIERNVEETLEEINIKPGGPKEFYLTHKIPLRDQNGKVVGILGVSVDITDKKKVEDELKHAEMKAKEFEGKLSATKAMAGGIAHELRTPLNAVLCGAKALENFFPRLIETYQKAQEANLDIPVIQRRHMVDLKDSVERIIQEIDYSNTIINMMLANVCGAEINKEDFALYPIAEIINHTIERYPFKTPKERALVHFDGKNDFQFLGGNKLLTQVLFNLMKNALYYVGKARKGEITIRLKSQGDKHILSFKDTGTGISKEDLPQVFEHFFSKTEHGTGIGLYFCKEVMQAFGGDITCRSEEGGYAEFILTFPKAPSA